MATIKTSKKEKVNSFFAKYSKCAKAAAIVVLAFFVLGACTIGGFDSPGKSYFAAGDSTAVIYLDYNDDSGSAVALDKIYLNVGAIYGDVGADSTITFRHASATLSSLSWSTSSLGSLKLGNLYSTTADVVLNANYNWIKAFDLTESGKSVSTTRKIIQMSFPGDMLVNEVVFVDKNGDVIPAYTSWDDVRGFISESNHSAYRDIFNANDKREGVENLLDAQENYKTGSTVYSNFTQDEMYTLMQIDGILLGNRTVEDNYITGTDSGPLAPLLSMVGVLVFGKSKFGLRIMSVLFTAALIAVAYLFGKRLFKSDAFGLLFAVLAAGGGLALTVGRLGLYFPFLALFAALAYYFMFKFFENGISDESPVKSGCNVLVSGLMFALAFAVDPKAVYLAIGLIALFVLGAVKQARRHFGPRRPPAFFLCVPQFLGKFIAQRQLGYIEHISGHVDIPVILDLHLQVSSRHVYDHFAVGHSKLVGHSRCRTGAGTGSQGVSGSTLVDLDSHMLLVNHLHDLGIDPVREIPGNLRIVTDLTYQRFGNLTHGDHTVRITDGDTRHRIKRPPKHHIFINHFPALSCHRDIIAPEGKFPHRHLQTAAVLIEESHLYRAVSCIQRKMLFLHIACILQILGKNPHTISAGLRLAAVRVPDLDKHAVLPNDRAFQHTVRSKALIAVTDQPHILRRQLQFILVRVKHHIIIPKPMIPL